MESKIDAERLIQQVQTRPAIWDMRHNDYADKNKRRGSWEEIVLLFVGADATVEMKQNMGSILQKKWKNIRDRYGRDVVKRKGKSGQAAKTTPPYMYAQQLSFLEDTLQPRRTTSSMDDIVAAGPDTEPAENRPSTSRDVPLEEPTRRPEPGKKRKTPSLEARLVDALDSNVSRREKKQQIEDDDDRLFLLSLLPQLKLVPPHQKLHARMQIMHALSTFIPQTPTPAPAPPVPISQLPPYQYQPPLLPLSYHSPQAQAYPTTSTHYPASTPYFQTQSAQLSQPPQELEQPPPTSETQSPLLSPTESVQSYVTHFSPAGSDELSLF